MKHLSTLLMALLLGFGTGLAQTNMLVTNPEAEAVLLGDFDPTDYAASVVIDDPHLIAEQIVSLLRPDSLRSYLEQMSAFGNRNTGSDTVSNTFGMGAARRWAYEKFKDFSAQHEDRLIPSYLQFDENICGMEQHRNIFGVLPGQGEQYDEVIVILGHLDSRCEDNCDGGCMAHGMEDNGSGSALVLELARVMSQFTFNRSIVFLLTTGEEQGLWGADAFAEYADEAGVEVKAALNNDIVGGIICGETASPPGCPGLNHIDSINVRIYSRGTGNSRHKQLARFVNLEYKEEARDWMPVKQVINILTPEDRAGRGGDHMAFADEGFPAIRFTSANEHGDGAPDAAYEDRQHTMEDVLGLDTDNDGMLDSFFVDFNYLARNAIINGNAAAMAAIGPVPPTDFDAAIVGTGIEVIIEDPNDYGLYRIGARLFSDNDWDTVYTTTQKVDTFYGLPPEQLYLFSAATVDANGVESLFSIERSSATPSSATEVRREPKNVKLLQNNPNPFDEATVIGVFVERSIQYRDSFISVRDLNGVELARLPIDLEEGLNEVVYDFQHHRYIPGTYAYSLVIDGKVVETKKMIYAY